MRRGATRHCALSSQKSAGIPYDVIQVPDPGIQAILDTAIREMYQMRYVIKDLPVFLLGPAGYNDYWVFDGSLVTEAADMLGRQRGCQRLRRLHAPSPA